MNTLDLENMNTLKFGDFQRMMIVKRELFIHMMKVQQAGAVQVKKLKLLKVD
eukprot:CAMPEP_0117830386 /NCGR_PEP_ID=MMETSP0949-20121206/8477_1 /TAXON_ID=44440 /ORGANISM="Chattonella subsalsa, Strain CCMP2191" /LENGTH=51 /DNA_ID=CAMNT_0005671411 /DNA_START=271 /DNA_END=426 /DNA_ORIENTATION=-